MTHPTHPSAPPARRTRTAASLKWLLNELYALRGRVERQTGAIESLEREEALLAEQLGKVRSRLESARAQRDDALERHAALRRTLETLHPDIKVDDRIAVNAYEAPHRKRNGELTQFILRTVVQAWDAGITTVKVMELAREEFGLTFHDSKERREFYWAVRKRLRQQFKHRGAIEFFRTGPRRTDEVVWRAVRAISFEVLEQMADAGVSKCR